MGLELSLPPLFSCDQPHPSLLVALLADNVAIQYMIIAYVVFYNASNNHGLMQKLCDVNAHDYLEAPRR